MVHTCIADELVVITENDTSDWIVESVSAIVATWQDFTCWGHIGQL